MKEATFTLTTLDTPDEVIAYLDAVGTPCPSLHPKVHSTGRDRWAGWNFTIATGSDADGKGVKFERWHFASGHLDISGQVANGGMGRLGSTIAFDEVTFPVVLFPAQSWINYPEWTPGHQKEEDAG